MLKISESYMIGVDIDTESNESAVVIVKVENAKFKMMKTYKGGDAERFYEDILKADEFKPAASITNEPLKDYRQLERTVMPVSFLSRPEAEHVLQKLKEYIENYAEASIADYYDLASVSATFQDSLFGWKDLSSAGIRVEMSKKYNKKNMYEVFLPPARKLD